MLNNCHFGHYSYIKRAQCVAYKATCRFSCCCGNTVVNHLMDADDIVLFTPSPNGLQIIVDVSYTDGRDNDIICNSANSQLVSFDILK